MAGNIDITLTWTTAAGENPVARWEVYRNLDGGGFVRVSRVTVAEYLDRVGIGSTAVYRIIAYDTFGAASPVSNLYTKSTTLASPGASVLNSDLVGVTATLTWGASAAGTFSVKDYLVQRNLNGAGYVTVSTVLAAASRQYIDTLGIGDSVSYRVVTRDFYGNSTNSNVETETVGSLTASVLTADTTDYSVSGSWTAASGPLAISYYELERNLNSGGYSVISTVLAANPRTFTDTLPAGGVALYRVRAFDVGAHASAYSNIESETPHDPYYSSVVLLIHANGTNGSTSFPDNAPATHTMTVVGDAVVTTAQAKFGTGSLHAPTGGNIRTGDSADFDFSTGDWTIEGWVYKNSLTGDSILLRKKNFSSVYAYDIAFSSALHAEGARGDGTTAYSLTAGSGFPLNQWVHVALTRNVNTMRLFQNGVLMASSVLAVGFTTLADNAGNLDVGSSITPSLAYYDDIRMTKGVARYTATFTPPAAQFLDS